MPDFDALRSDPAWLPHDYDAQTDRILFVHLPRAARRDLTFLADHKPEQGESCWVAGDALRHAGLAAGRISYLFHSAFCRSTLLVKAFETPGVSTGLSEPKILNTLARLHNDSPGQSLVGPVIALLARPMSPGEAVVVKPSNVVNRIIGSLMRAAPHARAILLSSEVAEFLGSIARKGLGGRIWARRLYSYNQSSRPLDIGLDARAMFELTDLQIAGLTWLQHRAQFAELLAGTEGSRFATLAMGRIAAGHADTLLGCAQFWDIALGAEQAAAIADGPLFARHAKLGGDFAQAVAEQQREARSAVTEEEISVVAKWIDAIAGQMSPSIASERPVPSR